MLVKYDAPQTVAGLLGHADNLNEPMPPLNPRPVILGIVITFMVRSSCLSPGDILSRKVHESVSLTDLSSCYHGLAPVCDSTFVSLSSMRQAGMIYS